MDVVWRKVWRDLARNKARTILAVLATAVGVFALGLTFGASAVIPTRMMEVRRATVPAHITFRGGPFDQDIIDAVRREPDVLDVEGETITSLRWKLEGEENWRDAQLIARDDYDALRINLVRLSDGRWPGRRALSVERLTSRHFDIHVGTSILVEFGGRERRVPVEGVAGGSVVLPPEWGGNAMFFATPETAAWLTAGEYGEEDFNQLHIRLESYSQEAAEDVAERVKRRLERAELSVKGYEITDPDVHWLQDIIDATLIILIAMSILSLGLSAFLIINTVNALLAQQVWQIGVMKAVGATLDRVARVYLATALIYGGLALLLAVPLGVLGAHLLSVWVLDLFNVEAGSFQINPVAVGIQTVVGVTVPLVSALVPVIGSASVTVREALSSHGIGSDFGKGWLDRLIGHIRFLPRPMALSLRNTFRRKSRVALTLAMLTLSGAIFTMVLSADGSFYHTLVTSFERGEDLSISLDRPHRISRLTEIAESLPGVTRAEVWSGQGAMLALSSGEEHPVDLKGVPSDSVMFHPRLVRGRGLLPEDGKALLIDNRFAEEEEIPVGEQVTVSIDGEETEWTVVGTYLSLNALSDDLFVPQAAWARATGTFARGETVMLLSENDDLESQALLIQALRDAYAAQNIEVVGSWSTSQQLEESLSSFAVMTVLLLTMVILTALVGGIGLMSTMSLNVVERRREIGVMRAIGAPSLSIVGIFVAEGVLVGVLSWLLAVPLSIPAARLFSNLIGDIVLQLALDFKYAAGGMLLWLLIVVLLSALASLWPALQAAQVSVREALAYE